MTNKRVKTDAPLSEREKLLLMAVAFHGLPTDVTRKTANGARILRQAMEWAGVWNEQTEKGLCGEGDHLTVEDWYATLIALSRLASLEGLLVNGYGNLGTDTIPPAYSLYTAFGLSQAGREYSEQLFTEYPTCRPSGDSS